MKILTKSSLLIIFLFSSISIFFFFTFFFMLYYDMGPAVCCRLVIKIGQSFGKSLILELADPTCGSSFLFQTDIFLILVRWRQYRCRCRYRYHRRWWWWWYRFMQLLFHMKNQAIYHQLLLVIQAVFIKYP